MVTIEKDPGLTQAHAPRAGDPSCAIILRLEDLSATPRNLERIGQKVEELNRQLAAAGAPFLLRVVREKASGCGSLVRTACTHP